MFSKRHSQHTLQEKSTAVHRSTSLATSAVEWHGEPNFGSWLGSKTRRAHTEGSVRFVVAWLLMESVREYLVRRGFLRSMGPKKIPLLVLDTGRSSLGFKNVTYITKSHFTDHIATDKVYSNFGSG